MKEEKIKLICVTKYPFIEVLGIGKFKKGKEYEFSPQVAKKLLKNNDEWAEVEKPIQNISKKTEFKFKKTKFKSKKSEVKNA